MTQEERLILLLSSQTISEEAKSEIKEIASSGKTSWTLLLKLASMHKIENLIYSNLRTAQLTGVLPEKIESHLKAVYYQVSIRNTQFKDLVESISSLCYKYKITLVKGSSLIYDFYQDAGARRLADVDILVRKEDRDGIWNELTGGGWSSDNWPGFKSSVHSLLNDMNYKTMHYLYYGDEKNQLFVDIHWKFYLGAGADAAAGYEIETGRKIDRNIFVPSDEMQIIHLCCNNMQDYETGGVMYLRNLCDIREIMASRSVNWNKIEQIFKISGDDTYMKKAVTTTLSVLGSLFDIDIPVQYRKEVFEGIDLTPMSLLQLPVTILKKGAFTSLKENLSRLGSASLITKYLFKEIVPDNKWLRGMYSSSHCPLLAYWSYMLRRHLLHKKNLLQGLKNCQLSIVNCQLFSKFAFLVKSKKLN